MESTVVEVGITSDVPQNQQIVEMVQGAVQAALRRNGNTNVTLVQLPIVYSSNENEPNAAGAAGGAETSSADNADSATPEVANTSPNPNSVVIEDVIDDDEDTPTNDQSENNSTASPIVNTSATDTDNNDNAARTRSTEEGTDNSRRRTGTPVLAGVIEQMRTVQNRLNPFIQQYYELLQNEPVFEETVS